MEEEEELSYIFKV